MQAIYILSQVGSSSAIAAAANPDSCSLLTAVEDGSYCGGSGDRQHEEEERASEGFVGRVRRSWPFNKEKKSGQQTYKL